MLRRMCKWLRIMGYDVQYVGKDTEDGDIMRKCRQENLILLTRDYELYNRVNNSLFIDEINYPEQVASFVKKFPPDEDKFFTRCPECNGILKNVNSREVSNKIPKGIVERFDTVSRCDNCGKFYWEGTHYAKIAKQIQKILEGA